jgi:hypothetical protein
MSYNLVKLFRLTRVLLSSLAPCLSVGRMSLLVMIFCVDRY